MKFGVAMCSKNCQANPNLIGIGPTSPLQESQLSIFLNMAYDARNCFLI
jgi:hypothetical protein